MRFEGGHALSSAAECAMKPDPVDHPHKRLRTHCTSIYDCPIALAITLAQSHVRRPAKKAC